MKHLPKHLQSRWRYLAVELEGWPDADFDRGEFQRDLWFAAQNLLGDVGSAEMDLSVLGFDFGDGTGHAVVRCRRGESDRARAVVACVDSVGDDPIRTCVRGVSGTVRACEEKYIRRPAEPSRERKVAFADADRRATVRGDRVDVRVDGGFAGATELDT